MADERPATGPMLPNPLSEREMEVAALLVTGASNSEIARDLVISPHTVKVHLRNIFEKLQVNSRTEASLVLVQHGWVIVPGVEVPLIEAPPPPPDPAPLADVGPVLANWQRGYLLVALLVTLLLFVAPRVVGLSQAPANLLSDANRGEGAPVAIRLEPRWELRTPVQQALMRHAMVAVDNNLYLFGGEQNGGELSAATLLYDLVANEWRTVAPLPRPLANLAAATTPDRRIFVAGGSTPAAAGESAMTLTDQLLEYDPVLNLWRTVAVLPYPVAGAALVADGDAVYLIGGWDGNAMRDEIWRYPTAGTESQEWEMLGHLERARAFLGAVVVGGEIYIAGGYDGQRELDLAEVFAPATGVRRLLPSMSTPRGGLNLVYDGLAVYALGGGWTRPVNTQERLDVATDTWSNFPSPVLGEWRNMGAAATDGLIHLTGGWSGDYLDIHLQYQSSFRSLLPVISSD
jgi:DNA-binding CsgD family transcriptional regulator